MITQIFHKKLLKFLAYTVVTVSAVVFVCVLGFKAAAEEKEKKETTKASEITGEVSVISRGYISIVYARDEKKGAEYEMMLPIGKDVKFIRKRLDELVTGDKVRVKCDDYFTANEEGKEICTRRVPKEVEFLSPSVNKLVSEER